jgi:hypothetical protein
MALRHAGFTFSPVPGGLSLPCLPLASNISRQQVNALYNHPTFPVRERSSRPEVHEALSDIIYLIHRGQIAPDIFGIVLGNTGFLHIPPSFSYELESFSFKRTTQLFLLMFLWIDLFRQERTGFCPIASSISRVADG